MWAVCARSTVAGASQTAFTTFDRMSKVRGKGDFFLVVEISSMKRPEKTKDTSL